HGARDCAGVGSGRRGPGAGAATGNALEAPADRPPLAPDLGAEAPGGAARAQGVHAEQAPAEENGDAVGDALDLAEDVRRYEDGEGSGEGPDQIAHLDDLPRIEPVAGLIEDQDLRPAQH